MGATSAGISPTYNENARLSSEQVPPLVHLEDCQRKKRVQSIASNFVRDEYFFFWTIMNLKVNVLLIAVLKID